MAAPRHGARTPVWKGPTEADNAARANTFLEHRFQDLVRAGFDQLPT